MKIIRYVAFSVFFLVFWSCTDKDSCDHTTTPVEVDFSSLEDSISTFSDPERLKNFLTNHAIIRDVVLSRSSYPNDSVFLSTLQKRFTHPSFDTLRAETNSTFGKGETIKQALGVAFAKIQQSYPSFKIPKIQTMITGLETDLFVTDSLVVIGLDYFLGSGATYRPNAFEYMLQRYQPDFVVPSIILILGMNPEINKTNIADQSILADMITYGKAYYFAKQILPCVPDHILIGYTSKEMAEVKENQVAIWKALVEDEVFYKSDFRSRQRYILERPKTPEIGLSCPGRIGTWVGWRIVEEYMQKNPNVSLKELMSTEDAQMIFKSSKYKPQ